jgi:ApeA-like protein/HEPN superfamily Apea-like protein
VESIDELGVFWLPDGEEGQLSGRLTFDPASGDGIRLALVGKFDAPRSEAPEQLHGWIGSKEVTLEDCIPGRSNVRSPGVIHSTYRANRMFVGSHLSDIADRLEFGSVTLELSDLASWVGLDDMTEIWDRDDPSGRSFYELHFTPSDERTDDFSRGTLSVSSRWKTDGRGQDGRGGIQQWPIVRVVYDKLESFDQILTDVRYIQDLLTLWVGRQAIVDRVQLGHPDMRVRNLAGDEVEQQLRIEYLAQPIRYTSEDSRVPVQYHQMLLTFEELGGVSVLAGWLDTAPRFHRSLMSMMSVQHAREMYMENRFLNLAFAAESFHRELYDSPYMGIEELESLIQTYLAHTPEEHHEWLTGRLRYANSLPLRKRLQGLATRSHRAGTHRLIRNRSYWANLVAQVRNDLTHLKSGNEQFHGRDLRFLSESIYFVVRICMLLASIFRNGRTVILTFCC